MMVFFFNLLFFLVLVFKFKFIYILQWSKDGEHLFCLNNGTVSVLSISTGLVVNKLGNSEDEDIDVVNTFCISNDGNQVITSHKSSLFKLWTWKGNN